MKCFTLYFTLVSFLILAFSNAEEIEDYNAFENPKGLKRISSEIGSATLLIECYGIDRFDVTKGEKTIKNVNFRALKKTVLYDVKKSDFVCLIFQPLSNSLGRIRKKQISKTLGSLVCQRVLIVQSYGSGLAVLFDTKQKRATR